MERNYGFGALSDNSKRFGARSGAFKKGLSAERFLALPPPSFVKCCQVNVPGISFYKYRDLEDEGENAPRRMAGPEETSAHREWSSTSQASKQANTQARKSNMACLQFGELGGCEEAQRRIRI